LIPSLLTDEEPARPRGEDEAGVAEHACPYPSSSLASPLASPLASQLAGPLSVESVFQQHGRYVASVVLRVLGRDHEVDDVVQEVFLTAMSGLLTVRNPSAVRGWLKTIAVRKACRHLRRRRLRTMLGLERSADCYQHLPAPGCSPEERALLHRVYKELDRLPVKERVAWTLRYIEGEQVDKVAELCCCSLATAKRRIAAAQALLERTLGHDR
jgi:RNA polymerase sigma-70 factor (ECF subfamily)